MYLYLMMFLKYKVNLNITGDLSLLFIYLRLCTEASSLFLLVVLWNTSKFSKLKSSKIFPCSLACQCHLYFASLTPYAWLNYFQENISSYLVKYSISLNYT